MEPVSAFVADLDHQDWRPFELALAGYAYAVHTTYSHSPEDPRFRVTIPLAAPVEAENWPEAWDRVNHWLFRDQSDRATRDCSRFFFLPAHPVGGAPFATCHEGAALDPFSLPPVPKAAPIVTVSAPRAPGEPVGDRPGDVYNARTTVEDLVKLLEGADWTAKRQRSDVIELWRPGKDRGSHSATINWGDSKGLYVFSSDAAPFEPNRMYDPFAVYTLLKHKGEWAAAARDLAAKGYGAPQPIHAEFHAAVTSNPNSAHEYKLGADPTRDFNACAVGGYPARETHETGFTFRKPSEIVAAAEETNWLVRGYIAEKAVTLLSGREKVGKTTWLFSAMRALQSGEPFMGQLTTRTGIIYLSEEGDGTLGEKMETFRLSDDGLSIVNRNGVSGSYTLEATVQAAVAHANETGAKLLVVDTLSHWAALRAEAENDAAAMTAALRPLTWAAGEGLAVLVVHHAARGTGEYRGSTAIGATVDIILSLAEDNAHGDRRVLSAKGRFRDTPARVVVELQGDSYATLGSPVLVEKRAREAGVLEVLRESTGPLAADVVAGRSEVPERRVQELLRDLVGEGLVIRDGTGKRGDPFTYRAAPGSCGAGDCSGDAPAGLIYCDEHHFLRDEAA